MPWYQIAIESDIQGATQIAERMETLGATAVSFLDCADIPVLEPPLGEAVLWPKTCVRGLFKADRSEVDGLVTRIGFAGGEQVTVSEVEDRDWVRETQDLDQPRHFGHGLWISPSGRSPPAHAEAVVTLDAGVAFGTGAHPTTRLCLEWLSSQAISGARILDFGCGSGVLALAALRRGADRALVVDVDPQALEAARKNAERNGLLRQVMTATPDDLGPGLEWLTPPNYVLANILLEPLLKLSSTLLGVSAPSGFLCLSGILESQVATLRQRYDLLSEISVATLDGWARLTGKIVEGGH